MVRQRRFVTVRLRLRCYVRVYTEKSVVNLAMNDVWRVYRLRCHVRVYTEKSVVNLAMNDVWRVYRVDHSTFPYRGRNISANRCRN